MKPRVKLVAPDKLLKEPQTPAQLSYRTLGRGFIARARLRGIERYGCVLWLSDGGGWGIVGEEVGKSDKRVKFDLLDNDIVRELAYFRPQFKGAAVLVQPDRLEALKARFQLAGYHVAVHNVSGTLIFTEDE